MDRVNLRLRIVVELFDAENPDAPAVPFDTEILSNYRGLKYADGLTVQKSLAKAISEHTERLFGLGDAKVAQ